MKPEDIKPGLRLQRGPQSGQELAHLMTVTKINGQIVHVDCTCGVKTDPSKLDLCEYVKQGLWKVIDQEEEVP